MSKQRLSASVDQDLIEAVENAVARGRSESVSAWVNDALRLKLDQDRRLEALAGFIAAYEAGHGEITPDEIKQAVRRARARAIPVRVMPADKSTSPHRPRRPR
ncbi:MAG TPA: ribbon-helix-helix protein, CopG family [Terriglobia bacterium]|jgi:Arc/MetJ-type ribon-helix-helix transcriptional regulator